MTLYRIKDHVDISGGPMIANTNFLGRRCTIAAVIIFFKLNIFGNTYNIYLFPKLFLGSSN